jgi:hypothetical protein
MLPFTRDQFLQVFADYNLETFPSQIVAYSLAAGMLVLLWRPGRNTDRLLSAGLALMWLWTGVVYQGIFFAAVNPVAVAFGAAFVLQAGLLIFFGTLRNELSFALPRTNVGWLGAALVTYSAVLYPLIGMWIGHSYPEMPMFGITPCPVTLFTFGLLLMTSSRVPLWVLVVPFVWSLIGGSAAVLLAVPQDWVLLASGFVVCALLIYRDRKGARRPVAV